MKPFVLLIAAVFALFSPTVVQAQIPTTTYSVIKATASIPGFYQDANNRLVKFTLSTRMVINLALGQDLNTPVPKNVILGYAGEFGKFSAHNLQDLGKSKLVVYQVDDDSLNGTKLATIGTAGARFSAENQIINKFRRSSSTQLTIANTGGTGNTFLGGNLLIGGTGTRKPNAAASVDTLTITAPTTATGFLNFAATRNGQVVGANIVLVVSKGSIVAKGKILGVFTDF